MDWSIIFLFRKISAEKKQRAIKSRSSPKFACIHANQIDEQKKKKKNITKKNSRLLSFVSLSLHKIYGKNRTPSSSTVWPPSSSHWKHKLRNRLKIYKNSVKMAHTTNNTRALLQHTNTESPVCSIFSIQFDGYFFVQMARQHRKRFVVRKIYMFGIHKIYRDKHSRIKNNFSIIIA